MAIIKKFRITTFKKERNKIFNISLAVSNKILFMADNLGKYYAT